jgi:hypothetical protein
VSAWRLRVPGFQGSSVWAPLTPTSDCGLNCWRTATPQDTHAAAEVIQVWYSGHKEIPLLVFELEQSPLGLSQHFDGLECQKTPVALRGGY